MSRVVLPNLQKVNAAHGPIDGNECSIFTALGDAPSMWFGYINSNFEATDYMASGVDGQIPAGHSTDGFKWVTLSGDATIANTGVLTVTNAIKTKFASSIAVLDLAGGAQNDVFIFCPDVNCTLVSAYLVFQTVAGSVAAAVSIGKPGDPTYFVNAESTATGGAQWDNQTLTLLNTDVVAGLPIFCSTDGVGDAGKVVVCLNFKVD
jgi:hypothetical protein